jgi:uncharacterized membrane protein YgdD (TMEM256/DUF423 family)
LKTVGLSPPGEFSIMNSRARLRIAGAVFGLLGVAFGAFGAHGIDDPAAKAWMQTGASYQLVHGLAALLAAGLPRPAIGAAAAFLIGAALFSGSLYAMALGGPHWLGAVTPLGGLGFLTGWVMLAIAAVKQPD